MTQGTHQFLPLGEVESPVTATNSAVALFTNSVGSPLGNSEITVNGSQIGQINPTYNAQTSAIPTEFYSANSTVVTTPVAGNKEYIDEDLFITQSTTSGRAGKVFQTSFLMSSYSTFQNANDFYGNGIPLVGSTYYEIDYLGCFNKTTTSTATMTIDYQGAAPTNQFFIADFSKDNGMVPNLAQEVQIYNSTQSTAFVTPSFTTLKDQWFKVKIFVNTGANTTGLKLKWAQTNGIETITTQFPSRWLCRRYPANRAVMI